MLGVPNGFLDVGFMDGWPSSLLDFGHFHQLCLSCPAYSADGPSVRGIRRSMGIHYTPHEIVDYLTQRVFDHLLAERESLRGVRILDPSCGCGAFLIPAARLLIRSQEVHRHRRLSTQERLDLLRDAIFGFDLDPQAVEWTRRMLLLAIWQDSGTASNLRLEVPDFRENIRCQDFLSATVPPVDAIVGGPPFVRLQKFLESNPKEVEAYRKVFRTAQRWPI